MSLLRVYNNHENSEQLVHSLMDHYDSQEVTVNKRQARSAKVIANDWMRNRGLESPEPTSTQFQDSPSP